MQLFQQTTMFLHFDELLRKRLEKVVNFVKKHEKSWIWPKLCNFSRKLPCLCISINFSGKLYKKCPISEKSTKNHRFGQIFITFRTNYHVFAFRWTFKEKVGESGSFREKARKIMDLVKTCNFPNKVPCFYVSMNFSANSCKNCLISWESTKTHRFGQNYATFSNKLPCFGVSMNFSAKDCKKWLNSWKSRKNHRFGQNFSTSRGNYHVFAFRSTFQEKVVRSASFRRKARKIIDLAKSLWLFEQTTMSLHFDELFRKKLQKVPHFVKKHENPSIWQKLATFRENYHVLTFRWTLQQKVAKSCSCREKERKVINLGKSLQLFEQTSMFLHFNEFSRKKLPKVLRFVKKHQKSSIWPKLCNFSSRLPCFGISMKFSGKKYKKCLISWKSTKNRRFGENSQLFQQTTMFWRFGELFREKLQKVLRFLRKLYKSSIGPKLATFSNKVPCLCVSMNFSAKGASFR